MIRSILVEVDYDNIGHVKELCEKNISLAELCRCIGQILQNFNKKLQRSTVSFAEMVSIAETLGDQYEQVFVLPDGKKVG